MSAALSIDSWKDHASKLNYRNQAFIDGKYAPAASGKTFDSINPFIVQGSGARGSLDLVFGNNVFDTLMMRSADEPFTLYPLLAETIETDDARTFAEFTLDARAKFSDGQPVTFGAGASLVIGTGPTQEVVTVNHVNEDGSLNVNGPGTTPPVAGQMNRLHAVGELVSNGVPGNPGIPGATGGPLPFDRLSNGLNSPYVAVVPYVVRVK